MMTYKLGTQMFTDIYIIGFIKIPDFRAETCKQTSR